MRQGIEAVIRYKKGGWPTLLAGVLWEAADIAGKADFLGDTFDKLGLWEMLKRGVSVAPLVVMCFGAAWLLGGWWLRRKEPAKAGLSVPQSEEWFEDHPATTASEEDVAYYMEETEERVERTTRIRVIRRAKRHA